MSYSLRVLSFGVWLSLLAGQAWADDEPTPETKALIARLREDLKSKSPATRAAAYKSMGELGEKGVSIRRTLCEGMNDPATAVSVAAADALKKVDPDLYRVAVAIKVENKGQTAVRDAGKLGPKGEPLTPIILKVAANLSPRASQAASSRVPQVLINTAAGELIICADTLVSIAPDDPAVNEAVIRMVSNPNRTLRAAAVKLISALRNKKLALPGLLTIAGNPADNTPTRVAAIEMVPSLTDENTATTAKKALEALRFDKEKLVREAVETAVEKIK